MKELTVKPVFLEPHSNIPNNQALPLLVYAQVFQEQEDLASKFKEAFASNNWQGAWVNGVFDYHHYHSKAHEVLGVAAGTAILILGGPGAEEIVVQAGDMLVLPAGTGHCLKSASPNFKVVGAYPAGQENYDICTEKDNPEEKRRTIATLALPTSDPVGGPLLQHWQKLAI